MKGQSIFNLNVSLRFDSGFDWQRFLQISLSAKRILEPDGLLFGISFGTTLAVFQMPYLHTLYNDLARSTYISLLYMLVYL
jgi:hypothetical protein